MKGPSPRVAATRYKVLAARRDSRIGPNGSLAAQRAQPLDTSLLQEGIRATQVAPAFTSVPPCGTAPERYGDDLARVPPFAPSPPAKEYVKINAVHLYFNADGTVAAQRAQETVSGEGKGRMRLTGVVPALKAEPACGTAEKLSSRNYTVTPHNQLGDRPFSARTRHSTGCIHEEAANSMKPIFEISDPIELLALWRLVAEAKFQENPEDADLWGSPFVHSLARRIADAMLDSYRLAGKTGDVERHQRWINSLPDNVVLPAVKTQLKRDAQGHHWPLSYEAKVAYVEGCIAPFLATKEFMRQLIDDAEAR